MQRAKTVNFNPELEDYGGGASLLLCLDPDSLFLATSWGFLQ